MSSAPVQSRARLLPIALAQAIGLACGIAGVKINSHLLPPATLGLYGLFLTCTPLGVWVVYAGLLKSAGRLWLAAPDRPSLLSALGQLWLRRLPWLAGAGLAAGLAFASGHLATAATLAVALGLGSALMAVGALAQTLLQAEAAHWRDCSVSAAASVSRTLLPPLMFAGGGGASLLWVGFGLHTAVWVAAGAWWLREYLRPAAGAAPAARCALDPVYTGSLFTLLALFGWALAGLNRWLVAWRFGDEATGYFTLAGGAAIVVTSTIGTVWQQYFQPGLYALGDAGAAARPILARRVDRIALLYTVSAAGGIAVFAWVAPWLVGPLIAPAYRPALVWIWPAGGFGLATVVLVYYRLLLLAGRCERACARLDLVSGGALAVGCLVAALLGEAWFRGWLLVSPAVAWLVGRPLARHAFFTADAAPVPAPGR